MSNNSDGKPELIINGKRLDGRGVEDLRNLRIEAGVLKQAAGSAYVEWGKNKIICGVYGPRECIPKFEASPYRALIKCRYMMAPFCSLEEHGRSGPSRRSTELSKVIREVFENLIISESFPRTEIDIYMEILQSDGGTRTAAITAACVALANAGIPLKDMVSALALGKADGKMVVDLAKEEDNFGESDFPVAVSHRNKELLLIQMDGMLTKEEISDLIDLAIKKSEEIHKKQSEALIAVYDQKEGNFVL
ncbi:MAG: exosome complex exonuclease Rrp41 [Candidatus Micrarchaeota archaeon]